ncbi:MAG: GNAT family N-acetyltransferase [Motilibacteraceae bacterium]
MDTGTAGRAVVRPAAGVEDFLAVGRVRARSWQAAYAGLVPQQVLDAMGDEAGLRERAERMAANTRARTYLALRDGTAVGFVSVGPERQEGAPSDVGEVYAIYADPGTWGTGVGRALMAAGLEDLAGHGCRQAWLWVLEGNDRAIAFYRRTGFVPTGDRTASSVLSATGEGLPELRYGRSLPA